MAGQLGEAEVGLDALEEAVGALLGVVALEVLEVVDAVLAGVALAHLEELGLVAAAGYGEGDAGNLHLGASATTTSSKPTPSEVRISSMA